LQLELPRIKKLGASLVAVSPQTPDNSVSSAERLKLTFEVLSDVGNRVARQFGIVFTLPEELRPIYAGFGIDIPAANGDDTFELPVPATYVIDHDRKIRMAFVDADHTQRVEPEVVISVLTKRKEEIKMAEIRMPHPGHENHLCYLQNVGYVGTNTEDYKELVKNTKFFCKNCGRAAVDDKNLCEPEEL
jgi:peroxiredoxin